jgi:hypothetical protein
VYTEILSANTAQIGRETWRTCFGGIDPEEIVIALELYHRVEALRPHIATRKMRVCTWRLGSLKLHSPLHAPSEIAAHAFAKAHLKLTCFPKVLECIALYPERVEAIRREFLLAEQAGAHGRG